MTAWGAKEALQKSLKMVPPREMFETWEVTGEEWPIQNFEGTKAFEPPKLGTFLPEYKWFLIEYSGLDV